MNRSEPLLKSQLASSLNCKSLFSYVYHCMFERDKQIVYHNNYLFIVHQNKNDYSVICEFKIKYLDDSLDLIKL